MATPSPAQAMEPALPPHCPNRMQAKGERLHLTPKPQTSTSGALRAPEVSTNNAKSNPIQGLLIRPFPLLGGKSNQLTGLESCALDGV